ncbi:MAG: aryl-sulfate sulfotransferase [Bacteroidota bacterium]
MKRFVPTSVVIVFSLFTSVCFNAQAENNAHVDYISPIPGSALNMPLASIIIRTQEEIDRSSITSGGLISVTGTTSGVHTGKLVLSDDDKTLVFVPDAPFTEGEEVTVNIFDGLHATNGSAIAPLKFNFTITPKVLKAPLPIRPSEGSVPTIPHCYPMSDLVAKDSTLPASFPDLSITTTGSTAPGYIFLSNFAWTDSVVTTPYLMILDNSGHPIFYKQLTAIGIDFDLQPNGHLTYFDEGLLAFIEMDSTYQVVNNYQCGNGYDTDLHELRLLPNGHALLLGDDPQTIDMSKIVSGGNPKAVVTGIIIQELDQAQHVVFQWRSWDHFQITDATHENLTAAAIDYVHSNALELDGDGNILLSSRHMDEITKIDRTTGNTIWRMGGKNNQFTFVNDSIGYSHQHAIRRLSDGNFVLFDNGNFHNPPFSRALEYQVDEVNKVATLVWQYRNNPDYVSPAMGYVQRLSNGNTFIGWGGTNPSVTEVTNDGKKVFEMSLPNEIVSYRAFRYQWNGSGSTTSGVEETNNASIPRALTLSENYPNPFNPSTTIRYSVPVSGKVSIRVYNILGQAVATLVDGNQSAGSHEVSFNGANLSSGIYFYRIESGSSSAVKKMVLLK